MEHNTFQKLLYNKKSDKQLDSKVQTDTRVMLTGKKWYLQLSGVWKGMPITGRDKEKMLLTLVLCFD